MTLLARLRGSASIDDLTVRTGVWLGQPLPITPTPDLNQDQRIDDQDARILYYGHRFREVLESSPALLEAMLDGPAGNSDPRAALDRANALIDMAQE